MKFGFEPASVMEFGFNYARVISASSVLYNMPIT